MVKAMPKYLISFNAGWGENAAVHECDDAEEAQKLAYELAREEFENNADYSGKLLTPELAEENGVDFE